MASRPRDPVLRDFLTSPRRPLATAYRFMFILSEILLMSKLNMLKSSPDPLLGLTWPVLRCFWTSELGLHSSGWLPNKLL